LESCHLTSLNYLIVRKIIVVVGRCIPYLITIFWWNHTVDYILVDLSKVTRILIHWNMLCSQNILFTFSSFVNSTQVNDILPSSSVGHLYRTHFTLPVSLGLTPWLNSLSWSLRPLNLTPRHRTFNLWSSPPLNCAWTSIHPAIASNLRSKKLKTINETLIQTFHQTLGVQIMLRQNPYLMF